MVFGRQDPHVPPDGRSVIHEALEKAGVYFSWHEFNAAHAFARDEGERYDAEATRHATGLALEMFQRCL
jgi:carboxymethylenebutenolidase